MPLTFLIRKAPVPLAVTRLPASDEAAWRALHAIADRLRPDLARRLREILAQAQRGLSRATLESLLVSVSEPEIVTALADAWDLVVRAQIAVQVQPVLQELVQQAALRARASFVSSLERLRIPPDVVTTRLTGDLMAPRAALWAEQHSGALVTQITQTTRDALGTAVRDALAHGKPIGTLTREIRGVIEQVPITTPMQPPAQASQHVRALTGLTPRQVGQVERFREGLLTRGVTGEKLVTRLERKASQLLRQRAELIARTEAITAAAAGQQALWEAAEREGLVDTGRARRRWVVTPDDALCFVAGTMVATPQGERPIEILRPGDVVCTQEGQQPLLATTARRYRGILVLAATTHGRLLLMTADHPVWSAGQWVEAHDLTLGSPLQTLRNEACQVESLIHLDLGEPDDSPAALLQGRRFACIACGSIAMPVDAIDFQGDMECRDHEIHRRAYPRHFAFLDEGKMQRFERFSDGVLQQGFALEATIAREGAEALAGAGLTAKHLVTEQTWFQDGRTPTAFGTIDPSLSTVSSESLAAALTMEIHRSLASTAQRTDGITVCNDLRNGKRLLTHLTGFRHALFCGPSVIASPGTEFSLSLLAQRRRNTKRLPTMFTRQISVTASNQIKALPRTIRIASFETITSGELLTTLCTGIGKRHLFRLQGLIKELINNYTITVYDMTVAKEHHFFAEDVLVHNCPLCRAVPGMNPEGVGLHEPFQTPLGPVMHPTLHPACRCAVVLTFTRRRAPFTAPAASLLAAD